MMPQNLFNRPGVSDQFLSQAGSAHVGAEECVSRYGFRAEGIAIPFLHINGSPVIDNDRPFARVRLYHATDTQKYHQRPGSNIHIYIPPTFTQSPKGSRLILVEGEFKSLALAEAGYAALGLCGFSGAARTVTTTNGARNHALNDELVDLLKMYQPAEVVFLGDADVVLNAQFALEAAKLRGMLCGSRLVPFVQKLTAAKLPLDGPKGVDDLRGKTGAGFKESFDVVLSNGYDVPAKASATEVFTTLLRREIEAVKRLLAQQGHESSRARIRLLRSAAQLWKETGAPLELKPLLADALGVTKTEVAGLVKDVANKQEGEPDRIEAKDNAQGSAVSLPDVEPWPDAVDGAETLTAVAAVFSHYLVLPPGAADALALWTAHAHCFTAFDHTPRANACSPDKGCGKTTLLDVLASMTPRPLRTESMTAAVLFRLVEACKPTLLLDEVDAYLCEAEELRGLLNAGHKRGARAYRCEGESNNVRGFNAFAPAALAGIGHLPGTLHDRSIVIRLMRAKPGELAARFDSRHIEAETVLCRKLARWTADNFTRLESCDPLLPEGAFNRLADNWRPLFAIAEAAGADWPARAAAAFAKLTTTEDTDAQGIGVTLLTDIAATFGCAGEEKLPSARLAATLAAMEGSEWAEWGRNKKPISPNQVAKLLRRFGVAPRTIKLLNGDTAKGYHREDFNEAFARFLPQPPISNRNPVTIPENIGDSAIPQPSPTESGLRLEKSISTNKDGLGYEVTVEKAPSPKEALLL